MNTIVLTARDSLMWNHYLSLIPESDIYYTLEYCRIYEENGEGQSQMFVYTEGDSIVCYPFLLRRIDHMQCVQAAEIMGPLFDITTPYGYGGPITNVKDPDERAELFERFSSSFQTFCGEQRIVSEFVRFHPILKNYEDYIATSPFFSRNTICLSLTDDEEIISGRYKVGNRNRIRRAYREGLAIRHADPSRLEHFVKLYYSTMDKNNAHSYYYFSETFFYNTVQFLEGSIELIEVLYGDKIIASCLFMHYNKYVHYHLLGSDKTYLKFGPINLLVHEAMLWAKNRGYEYLHLGGGYTGNDSLYEFKQTFNMDTNMDYYLGKKIHLPDIYNKLAEAARGKIEDDSYFPIYRHPALQQQPLSVAEGG
ncbi:GNAT family N-acetyltransferase [Paenibacillus ginsengarvi]|nr:GNAT family N-acetyltransferase [Paenibacillus ginsengarvi]